ncbi:hypothetical protein AB6A40_003577 [Gnathostoma spinigerum]|uniref:ZP domain-containing protein n=1 Tax=Gnathostoma spinigerum TaxID=75299 RepID=A0ABD6EA00_9BILA
MDIFISVLLIIITFVSKIVHGSMGKFSKLVESEVRVKMEPIKFVGNFNLTNPSENCWLTLHRGSCSGLPITPHDTIAWDTRLCFVWTCDIAEYAMRVESCWAGSRHHPIYLISKDGCTAEPGMISSPTYNSRMQQATANGWLSVRHVGRLYISLSCDIRLCHICDESCRLITPPISCEDYSDLYLMNRERMFWNQSTYVAQTCTSLEQSEENENSPNNTALQGRSLFLLATIMMYFLLRSDIVHLNVTWAMLCCLCGKCIT